MIVDITAISMLYKQGQSPDPCQWHANLLRQLTCTNHIALEKRFPGAGILLRHCLLAIDQENHASTPAGAVIQGNLRLE